MAIRQTIAALETQIARGTSVVVVQNTSAVTATPRPPTATPSPSPSATKVTLPVLTTVAPATPTYFNLVQRGHFHFGCHFSR